MKDEWGTARKWESLRTGRACPWADSGFRRACLWAPSTRGFPSPSLRTTDSWNGTDQSVKFRESVVILRLPLNIYPFGMDFGAGGHIFGGFAFYPERILNFGGRVRGLGRQIIPVV